jgi:haloacetate dehalogenase
MGAGNHADLWAALHQPAVVHGMVEDYRAGLGIDRAHDAADRDAGRRVACPTLLLESAHDDLDIHGNPADIWAPWLTRPLRHHTIDSGHHQAEQAPDAVADALLDFLTETP